MQSIKSIWQEIIDNLPEADRPRFVDRLQPGASDEEIIALESAMNLKLPTDYRESLQTYNGSVYLGDMEYLEARVVPAKWAVFNSMYKEKLNSAGEYWLGEGEDKVLVWSCNFIPFAQDSGGNTICIESSGQRLLHWEREILTDSFVEQATFTDWLLKICNHVKSGQASVEESGSLELIDFY